MPGTVIDNAAGQRFELAVPGGIAFIDYRREGTTLWLLHAEVPADLRGQGVGAQLVRATLELVRSRGEQVIPVCGYVRSFIARHAEFADLAHAP